ncbi:MAG: MAPEG family protein [Nitratireductor sp.]|nr:MAPEG family protein [Nitratireductor sp.]
MEAIEPLWTFAADWKVRLVVLITIANMVLAVRLYTAMAKARVRVVKAGKATTETYRATQNEPEEAAVFNRAVMNQFESPTIFYALIAISLALGVSSWLTVILAALYVAIRWRHGYEMIGEHVVLRRRKLFVRSVQVLMALMVEVTLSALLWA